MLNLSDDEFVGNAKLADYKQIGEIEVRCHWVRKTGTVQDIPFTAEAAATSTPEKCLKGRAISNQAM